MMLGFLDLDAGERVETFCKTLREFLRHVLHDDQSGTSLRDGTQHLFQRLWTSGRSADGDDPGGHRNQPVKITGRIQNGICTQARTIRFPAGRRVCTQQFFDVVADLIAAAIATTPAATANTYSRAPQTRL